MGKVRPGLGIWYEFVSCRSAKDQRLPAGPIATSFNNHCFTHVHADRFAITLCRLCNFRISRVKKPAIERCLFSTRYYQERTEPPKAARGHVTCTDGEVLRVTKIRIQTFT